MYNKVMLLGNLGQDPQVRNGQSANPVTTFDMATSRRWTDREGNRQEDTEWHRVVCFGRLADIAAQYLSKGRQVLVEGRLQTNQWKDRHSGETRYRTEIVCGSLQMLGQRNGAADGGAEDAAEPQAEKPAAKKPAAKKPAAKKPAAKKPAKRSPAKRKPGGGATTTKS